MKTLKMTKKLLLASVALPFIISASSAFAYGGKDHKDHHDNECRPGLDREIMKELNLTDSQKEQFKTLRQSHKEDMKDRAKGHSEQRGEKQDQRAEQLNDLLLADTFDAAKATAMAKEMQSHREERKEKQDSSKVERQVQMLSKQHEMLSILTPEQKAKFIELQKDQMQECGDDNEKSRRKGKDRN